MALSAPQSPIPHRSLDGNPSSSPPRSSPSKLLRTPQHSVDRSSSLPPRRLSPAPNKIKIRPRLNRYHTIDDAVSLLKSSKNIIVLTGAGISTSCGVPDFRSKDGECRGPPSASVGENLTPLSDPQELFHIENFVTDPEEFFRRAKDIFPKMQGRDVDDSGADSNRSTGMCSVSRLEKRTSQPQIDGKAVNDGGGRHHGGDRSSMSAFGRVTPRFSVTHAFLSLLQSKGKLLTNYTQNIDGLETAAGVSSSKLIQCHGTLSTATCMTCKKKTTARKYLPVVNQGAVPFCKCSLAPPLAKRSRSASSGKKRRKRHDFEDSSSDEAALPPRGLIKPDITFFGEQISQFYRPRLESDQKVADLLLIIGTSLKVAPVNEMLLALPPGIPQIWISKERCQREGVKVDIELLGECDVIVEELCRRAGWANSLKQRLWEDSQREAPNSQSENVMAVRAKQETLEEPNDEQKLQGGMTMDGATVKRSRDNCPFLEQPRPPASGGSPIAADAAADRAVSSTVSAATKVTVELEEGTTNRWYVKRVKSA